MRALYECNISQLTAPHHNSNTITLTLTAEREGGLQAFPIRDAKVPPKFSLEPGMAPQTDLVGLASSKTSIFKHRSASPAAMLIPVSFVPMSFRLGQSETLCDRFPGIRHEPGSFRSGFAKSPVGPGFRPASLKFASLLWISHAVSHSLQTATGAQLNRYRTC